MFAMGRVRRIFLLLALAPPLWPAGVLGAEGRLTGVVSSRERVALPPGYVLQLSLKDVSRQDVAADEIAFLEMRPKRQPPVSFVLRYHLRRIDPSHSYAVSARILIDGRLAFVSTQRHSVLTRGASNEANILVQSVGRPAR